MFSCIHFAAGCGQSSFVPSALEATAKSGAGPGPSSTAAAGAAPT